MTKKDLVKIIREVVKIEVKKQVNEIFIQEEKSSSLKSFFEYFDEQSIGELFGKTEGFKATEPIGITNEYKPKLTHKTLMNHKEL